MTFSELIAMYLFLGGTAAGAFAVGALADLYFFFETRKELAGMRCERAVRRAYYEPTHQRIRLIVYGASFVVLLVGVLCLIADLGKPGLFYYIMMYPTKSYISIGAFALGAAMLCMLFALADAAFVLPPWWGRAALVAKTVGIPVAIVVMVYTGLLLNSVVAVGFWQSAWLPVLFLASALSCGCAVSMLSACVCEGQRTVDKWKRVLVMTDVPFVIVEAFAAVLFLSQTVPMADQIAMHQMFFGAHAPEFWLGFVGCGIVLPLAIELPSAFTHDGPPNRSAAIVAALVLLGGICLRFVVVSSGVQTALG